jgi:hypothetical protein
MNINYPFLKRRPCTVPGKPEQTNKKLRPLPLLSGRFLELLQGALSVVVAAVVVIVVVYVQ